MCQGTACLTCALRAPWKESFPSHTSVTALVRARYHRYRNLLLCSSTNTKAYHENRVLFCFRKPNRNELPCASRATDQSSHRNDPETTLKPPTVVKTWTATPGNAGGHIVGQQEGGAAARCLPAPELYPTGTLQYWSHWFDQVCWTFFAESIHHPFNSLLWSRDPEDADKLVIINNINNLMPGINPYFQIAACPTPDQALIRTLS